MPKHLYNRDFWTCLVRSNLFRLFCPSVGGLKWLSYRWVNLAPWSTCLLFLSKCMVSCHSVVTSVTLVAQRALLQITLSVRPYVHIIFHPTEIISPTKLKGSHSKILKENPSHVLIHFYIHFFSIKRLLCSRNNDNMWVWMWAKTPITGEPIQIRRLQNR